jgi:RNA polymerase sigma-70 factor (ECF subfamily)
LRAFVTLGSLFKEMPSNPRVWLFRVASNLWIDRMRRVREVTGDVPEGVAEVGEEVDTDAARTLLVLLSPQERTAVLLKDVFDFTLEEVAESLSTTIGAVKIALHRGRTKLAVPSKPESVAARAPKPEVLNAFCDAFNARDLDRMTALLLEQGSAEIVGVVTEYGREAVRDPETGSFYGMMFADLSSDDPQGGLEKEVRKGVLSTAPRAELRNYRGETIVLFWYAHEDGEAVRAVARVEVQDDHIARVRNYFFTPEVIAEVCRELDVPYRINGYLYWPRAGATS